MSFSLLALVVLVGLLGPVLAGRASWHLPAVVGELLGGLLVGASGLRLLDSSEPTFTVLAQVGFALVMFVVGSNVPVRDSMLRGELQNARFRDVANDHADLRIDLTARAGFGNRGKV